MALSIAAQVKKLFYPLDVTPLPWKMLTILVLICLFHDMDITMIFSFAPKMVTSFGVSEVEAGIYAGWLESFMYIGVLLCTFIWSYIGDKKGKKVSIVISTTLLVLSILAFGFSYNYMLALITRFLQGCSFGALVVTKSLLNEELDDTNMALGMAIITSTGAVGLIIGPSLAGYLVFPCELYPGTFSNIKAFQVFPVLLPHLVIAIGLLISVVLAVIHLPGKRQGNMVNSSNSQISGNDMQQIAGTSANEKERNISLRKKISKMKIMKICKLTNCLLSCILYGLYGFACIACNVLFSLIAATNIEYHGMGFTTSQIGTVLMIASIILIIVQVPILTKVTARLGARKAFTYLVYTQAILIPLIPAISLIRQKMILWPLICLHTFVLRLCVSGSFLTIIIMVNNSCTPDLNVTANGLGFALTALGRLIAPTIFGTTYSWSLTNIEDVKSNKHPLGLFFNQFFSFILLSTMMLIIGILSTLLTTQVNTKLLVEDNRNSDYMINNSIGIENEAIEKEMIDGLID